MRRFLVFILAAIVVFAFAQKIRVGVAIPAADHGWTGGMVLVGTVCHQAVSE